MKYFGLVLMLLALPGVSHAFCTTAAKPPQPGDSHCIDEVDLTRHAIGSIWRNSECMDCTCGGCCSAYSTPREFPADCVSVFDKQACEYKVHKRDDPTVLCPIFGAVGK